MARESTNAYQSGSAASLAAENTDSLLRRSRLIVWLLVAGCTLYAGLSLMLFLFQTFAHQIDGVPYYLQAGSWNHLARHAFGVFAGGLLAKRLTGYLLSLQKFLDGRSPAGSFHQALARCWYSLALCVALWLGLNAASVGHIVWLMATLPAKVVSAPAPRGDGSHVVELRLAEEFPQLGFVAAAVPGRPDPVYVHNTPLLMGADIFDAEVQDDERGGLQIAIGFRPAGAERLREASRYHIDRPIAVLFDGQVIAAPIVRAPLGSRVVLQALFTRAEAEDVVAAMLGNEP